VKIITTQLRRSGSTSARASTTVTGRLAQIRGAGTKCGERGGRGSPSAKELRAHVLECLVQTFVQEARVNTRPHSPNFAHFAVGD
jgi:hypothetical protein